MSCYTLSLSFHAFTSNLERIKFPTNIQEVWKVPESRATIREDMQALIKMTWQVVSQPQGKEPVGCKWVCTIKYKDDSTNECYKAHIVAKGFTKTYGINYIENFTHVAKLNTGPVLLLIVSNVD